MSLPVEPVQPFLYLLVHILFLSNYEYCLNLPKDYDPFKVLYRNSARRVF